MSSQHNLPKMRDENKKNEGNNYLMPNLFSSSHFDNKTSERFEKENPMRADHGHKENPKIAEYVRQVLKYGLKLIQADFNAIQGYMPRFHSSKRSRTLYGNVKDPLKRFQDIDCHKQTLVEIGGERQIHANWVDITSKRKAILTQLPLPSTAELFWKMIMEQNVQCILLFLTKDEFSKYQANNIFSRTMDSMRFADEPICVEGFRKYRVDQNWTLSLLTVSNGLKKKYVHLHHYCDWTHGKELENVSDLWRIQNILRNYNQPPVYMSLSGCGRAGTYAAFEIAHEQLHSADVSQICITDCVMQVRNGRKFAVQRVAHIKTIHLALIRHIIDSNLVRQRSQSHEEMWKSLFETSV